jgi:hypothetical protein
MLNNRLAGIGAGLGSCPPLSVCQTGLSLPRKAIIAGLALAAIAAYGMTSPALGQGLGPAVYVSGSVTATITVTFTAAPPAGSAVSCSLSLISNDPRGPSDTNSTSAAVSGSSAVCQITMYYYWRLTAASLSSDTMTFAYSVAGPTQTSSGLVNIPPMPPSGAQTVIAIPVTQ